MKYVNEPYKVYFKTGKLISGLTDVYLKIQIPGGSIVGPFIMVEMPGVDEKGIYYYDYTPLVEGQFLFETIIPSISDKQIKSENFIIKQNISSLLDRFSGHAK